MTEDEASESEMFDLSALFDSPVSSPKPFSETPDTQMIEEMPFTTESLIRNQKSDPTLTKYFNQVLMGSDVQDSICLYVEKVASIKERCC